MVLWRRRNDGFEWHKHVRTTIRIRREDRRRRIEGARLAAVDGLKGAGRAGVEAGSSGISLAGKGVSVAADTARAGIARLIGSIPTAWVWLCSTTIHGLRAACTPIQSKGVQPLLATVGVIATIAALFRLLSSGLSADAVFTFLIGLAGSSAAALPILFGKQALPRGGGHAARAWLSAQLKAAPARLGGLDLSRKLRAMSASQLAGSAVMLLFMGSAVLGGGWLVWRGMAVVAGASGAFGQTIEGRAAVLTGDVLRIGETEIRLAGIEAPEMGQICSRPGNRRWRCGRDARSALVRSVRGETVSCSVSGQDDRGRALGRCFAGDEDIARSLVREGHVFARTGLFAKYAAEEDAARDANAGLWRGEAERPSEYRAKAAERLAKAWEEAKKTAPDGCPIKGRIQSGRRKYYVLPGTADYPRIRIRTRRGERWFCTEEEAQAAGWQRSPRS